MIIFEVYAGSGVVSSPPKSEILCWGFGP